MTDQLYIDVLCNRIERLEDVCCTLCRTLYSVLSIQSDGGPWTPEMNTLDKIVREYVYRND
jgi:hypothetical protein